jgi:protein gp37
VFSASLSDWADNHHSIDPSWRLDLAALIIATPNLRWMLLTKRIGNVEQYLREMFPSGVPRNVALGITVVNQAEADRDIPRAADLKQKLGIRWLFLSMEPLLGQVIIPAGCMPYIDLIIVGGESGKDARPMHPGWAVSIEHQCQHWLVPFHFKQWGEWLPVTRLAIVEGGVTVTKRIGQATIGDRTYKADRIHHFPDDQPMVRVGTKLAGRMLLGREHLERLPA